MFYPQRAFWRHNLSFGQSMECLVVWGWKHANENPSTSGTRTHRNKIQTVNKHKTLGWLVPCFAAAVRTLLHNTAGRNRLLKILIWGPVSDRHIPYEIILLLLLFPFCLPRHAFCSTRIHLAVSVSEFAMQFFKIYWHYEEIYLVLLYRT